MHVTDNVVVVVDASGSMGTPMRGTNTDRMSVAKDALKQVLGNSSSTHVGVIVFPNGNWVYPLGPRNDERLNGAIDSITSQGGTPLGEYMKQGADALLEARKNNLAMVPIGCWSSRTARQTMRVWLMATRRTSSPAASPSMLSGWRCIAAHAGHHVHSYRSADDPESLRQAINEVFAEVSAVDAGSTGENAFEMIADLPGETASAMLKTLSTTGNEPIKHHAVMRRADPPQQRNTASPSSTPNQSGPSFDDEPNAMEMFGAVVDVRLSIADRVWNLRGRESLQE